MILRLLLLVSCVLLAGCKSHSGNAKSSDKAAKPVVVTMDTSRGPIVVELDPARAPVTVANFLKYADAGAYNGTTNSCESAAMRRSRMRPNPLGSSTSTARATSTLSVLFFLPWALCGSSRSVMAR